MYTPQNFERLIGVQGFSEQLLRDHFTLYEGYVKNTNTLLHLLDTKEVGTPEYAELQRRFGWEWDGMRMHELYFGNMSKDKNVLEAGALKSMVEKVYGSVENWQKNFVGVGTMRGIGWAVLVCDKESGELFTIWVNEHDVGHLVGTVPLLVMDCFEHAYIRDYGIKRADYVTAFMSAIDWGVVAGRLPKT